MGTLRTWQRTMSAGQTWTVEVETDKMTVEDGLVVTLWAYDDEDGPDNGTIAQLSAKQAREIAAHLVECAERIENA